MRAIGDLSGNADQDYVHPDHVAYRETRSLQFRRDLAEFAACLRCRITDSLGRPGWCADGSAASASVPLTNTMSAPAGTLTLVAIGKSVP